jgi:hypothetical protein
MNTFLIGTRLEIHHSPDWSGPAFLAFDDAEYRIPGEAAKILVEKVRTWERERGLHEVALTCTACGGDAGKVWLTRDQKVNAVCDGCRAKVAALAD